MHVRTRRPCTRKQLVDPLDHLARRIVVLHQEFLNTHVTVAEHQHALRLGTVPAGAPGFLIVGLQRARQVVVHDPAYIGLVDPHAESVGRHDETIWPLHEGVLRLLARCVRQPGVVKQHLRALPLQERGDLLRRPARRGVDNRAAIPLGGEHFPQGLQLGFLAVQAQHPINQVGAVKAVHEGLHVRAAQLLHDVLLHVHRCRGSEGQHLRPVQRRHGFPEAQVIGAKIVPPFGYAMGFVDREKRHMHARNGIYKPWAAKTFRRDVQQVVVARPACLQTLLLLARRQRAVDVRGGDALGLQGVDLILHQGDERRNDQRAALPEHRRQLVAEGFAAAGGHDRQNVAPFQHRFHYGGLTGPKIAVPEALRQNVTGSTQGVGCCHGFVDSVEMWERTVQTGNTRSASIAQGMNDGQRIF